MTNQTIPCIIELPASKSIAARALILQYIYGDKTELENLPDCDDTRELNAALQQLRHYYPRGEAAAYNLGSGGTSLRFFIALAASLPGFEGIIDCSDTLKRRPLSQLIDALRKAGASIEYLENAGQPPLKIHGRKLHAEGVSVHTNISSQFLSAIMMSSTLWDTPFTISKEEIKVSRPYAEMTERMTGIFSSQPEKYKIEADWSAAAFFYEYALLHPGVKIFMPNLYIPEESLQGDSACMQIFSETGVESRPKEIAGKTGIEIEGIKSAIESVKNSSDELIFDLSHTPDLTPALAIGMASAGYFYFLTGIENLRHKESNRINTILEESLKGGLLILNYQDKELSHIPLSETQMGITGKIPPEAFCSHGDHRIAMAIAAAGLSDRRMQGADCVSKSFPGFFHQLATLPL